jgi:hypothetical protein
VTAKQPNLAWVQDTNNIIALLKQEATEIVNDDRTSSLAMPQRLIVHFPFAFRRRRSDGLGAPAPAPFGERKRRQKNALLA